MGKSVTAESQLQRFIKKRFLLVLFVFWGVINNLFAKNSSLEFWPETDIWYRLNPSFRLSSFIAITKYNESKTRDLNIYFHADYAWGRTKHSFVKRLQDENRAQTMKSWMIRGGYMTGSGIGENDGDYSEDLVFAELHRRIPLKGDILFSQRLRTDFRWLGRDPVFSYRFRYRIMLEKEYSSGKTSIVPYVNAEPYWDSRYNSINRIRLIGGATVSWQQFFAIEGNITYQYDSKSSSQNVYAINVILHIFFEKKTSIVNTSDREQPWFNVAGLKK